jgi:Fic family protein
MLVDESRIARFRDLAAHLAGEHTHLLPVRDPSAPRHRLQPFYEAYFSNFIEGTTFTLDEAADIVFERAIPDRRPQDAHDVLDTYRLAEDPVQRIRRARTGPELSALVTEWHGSLMAGRPETDPGRFRDVGVQAGNTVFVRHELVRGTLEVGFEALASLADPFARAVLLHFLLTEVHPFRDGNGRISRLAMNAELSAGGETRVIVPTGFRDEYLGSLKAASNLGRFEALVSVLDFARRWTAQMDFTSREAAEPMLHATNALAEASEVRDLNLKLRLPSRVSDAG